MFIGGTLIVPTLYCVIWFGIWGGEGIRMQRLADKGNLCKAAYSTSSANPTANCALPEGVSNSTASLAGTCGSYSRTYSKEYKEANSMGWKPSCVLDSSYHGGYGKCQENAFAHYTEVGTGCVSHTKWVEEPCGGAADPTSSTQSKVTVSSNLAQNANAVGVTSTAKFDVGDLVKVSDGSNFEYHTVSNVSSGTLELAGTLGQAFHENTTVEKKWPIMNKCSGTVTKDMVHGDDQLFNKYPPEKQRSCFYPLQDNVVCLYNQATTDILFDQVSSYAPRAFSVLLSTVTLITLTFYFVTSSDSGSLVVDIISGGGHPDPPLFQRIFWSFTEGATAIALLFSGVNAPNSNASLKALQGASIAAGLPYTFILFWCSQALALLVQEECWDGKKGLNPERKAFSIFIINSQLYQKHLMNTAVPGLAMGRLAGQEGRWPFESGDPTVTGYIWTGIFSCLYYLALILLILGLTPLADGWYLFVTGVVFYLGFGTLLGLVRYGARNRLKIEHGDLYTDFQCGILAPMFTISQIEHEIELNSPAPPTEELEL